jgi:glycosyltransferase involved in cell wall biosynthesis
LFFGNIAPYKGLEYLIEAFDHLVTAGGDYRLIVAGRPKKGCGAYADQIYHMLSRPHVRERTIARTEFIPDEETELYFKAADVSVLPYTHIFQSGVLFLGYSFGLPAIAADVGSLRDDIVEGETGFMFKAQDSVDLERTVERYFASSLCQSLPARREQIRQHFNQHHSWDAVAATTLDVYAALLSSRP